MYFNVKSCYFLKWTCNNLYNWVSSSTRVAMFVAVVLSLFSMDVANFL